MGPRLGPSKILQPLFANCIGDFEDVENRIGRAFAYKIVNRTVTVDKSDNVSLSYTLNGEAHISAIIDGGKMYNTDINLDHGSSTDNWFY